MRYLHQLEPSTAPPALELSSPSINVDVRRRGFDPFLKGVAIGAVAAIAGVMLGLFLFLPT